MVGLAVANPIPQEGRDYIVLDKPIQSIHPDKIELIKIFSYACVHCQELEHIIKEYTSHLHNSKVVLRAIHVYWMPEFMNLIRISIAVDENKLSHVANQSIFNAVLKERVNLFDEKTTISWLNVQTRFDGKKVAKTYQSNDIKNKAEKMYQLTQKHSLDSTPTLIVDGKYRVKFDLIKSKEDIFSILDGLISLSKKDRLPIKTVMNSGGMFTLYANQTK